MVKVIGALAVERTPLRSVTATALRHVHARFVRLARGGLAHAAMLMLAWAAGIAHAEVIRLDALPDGPLGRYATVLVDAEGGLWPADALALQRSGKFSAVRAATPKFGIGAPPVWLHLEVRNTAEATLARRMLLGTPWIDRLDVYLLREGRIVAQWSGGDAVPDGPLPVGALGYAFDAHFAPGLTEVLIRAETPDPMVLPLRLLDPDKASALLRLHDYGYGLLYGFLFALIAYNAMLHAGGLRERSHLDYAIYLSSFMLLSLSYSGHGYAWLWPGMSHLQQYIILVLMVVCGCAGLRFAQSFLELTTSAPRLSRALNGLIAVGLSLILLASLFQQQAAAAVIAFVFILVFSTLMVYLGVLCARRKVVAAGYFLVGALTAMLGTMATALTVWLPEFAFHDFAFHAAEMGMAVEGTLLALALAYRLRRSDIAHAQAVHLSRTDTLTGLLNRRAFLDQAGSVWHVATRNSRPLSLIVLDLDHFKVINDTYGHAAGDKVLVAVAGILQRTCRRGDLAARWGGEEFILLLPETDNMQARATGERLLAEIHALAVRERGGILRLSASLGTAQRDRHGDLESLIREADAWMYRAKETGRGRVLGQGSHIPESGLAATDPACR